MHYCRADVCRPRLKFVASSVIMQYMNMYTYTRTCTYTYIYKYTYIYICTYITQVNRCLWTAPRVRGLLRQPVTLCYWAEILICRCVGDSVQCCCCSVLQCVAACVAESCSVLQCRWAVTLICRYLRIRTCRVSSVRAMAIQKCLDDSYVTIHMCHDHSYVPWLVKMRRDSSTCVLSRIAHPYVWHDSFTCAMTFHIWRDAQIGFVTHPYVHTQEEIVLPRDDESWSRTRHMHIRYKYCIHTHTHTHVYAQEEIVLPRDDDFKKDAASALVCQVWVPSVWYGSHVCFIA